MTKKDHQIIATWLFGGLTFIFLAGVFLLAPAELPPFKLKILALFSATLAGFFSFFLAGSLQLTGTGKFPVFGELAFKAGGGIGIFILVLLWWGSEYAPIKPIKKHAIVPVIENKDLHLGDNVYPDKYGFGHNPLYMRIYPQDIEDIVFFNKKGKIFLAGRNRQTVIGQYLAEYINSQISGIDFSAYKSVSCYQTSLNNPVKLNNISSIKNPTLRSYLEKGFSERFVQIDPYTVLYSTNNNKGNFYEEYAAVGLAKTVNFTIPLAKSNMEFEPSEIGDIYFIIECYHGGLRQGQKQNFYLLINRSIYTLNTHSHNMREKEEIRVKIKKNDLNFTSPNVIGVFVMPWQEERPKDLKTNIGPAHFRDVGIVNAYFSLKES